MILANFTVNRWITVGRLEREGGGFFFLDGSSRHRAIFPSLCAAGILRDKSDKSIRHAELTYDPLPPPRCRVCVHVAKLLPFQSLGNGQHFTTIRSSSSPNSFSFLAKWTDRRDDISLSLSLRDDCCTARSSWTRSKLCGDVPANKFPRQKEDELPSLGNIPR